MTSLLVSTKCYRSALSTLCAYGRRDVHISAIAFRGRTVYYNKHKKVTDPKLQDVEYFEKAATNLPLDGNYVDALQALYTEKVGSERELAVKGEDRLIGRSHSEWLPAIDRTRPCLRYAHCDALSTAPEPVKRIFSIEFGMRKDLTDSWKQSLIGEVRKHELDSKSLEVRIAWLTTMIRHLTMVVDEINNVPRKPVHFTHRIWLMVNHRRKLLRLLRETDTKSFEEVLSKLKIAYHVPKLPEQMVEKRSKAWGEAQLRLRVDREKEARLASLHDRYLSQRKTFEDEMKQKEAALAKEEAEIKEKLCGIAKLEGRVSLRTPDQLQDHYWESHKYYPSMMDSLAERILHSSLFYFPKPLATKNM